MLLISLPVELLTRIFEFVDVACPLTAVSSTCKTLNGIAEPLLYRNFCQQSTNASSMGLFARAIISRPHLARYVRSFEGSTTRPGVKIPDTAREGINLRTIYHKYPTDRQRAALRASLPDTIYGRDYCDAWYFSLTNWFDNWDAFLGFILYVCSKSLKRIILHTPGLMSPYLRIVLDLGIMGQHSSAEQPVLSNLKQVDLKYDNRACKGDRGISIDFVLPFLRLKSVDTISITGFRSYMAMTSEFSKQHCFAIKHLTLTNSRISATSLVNFLGCFKSLQYFEYEHTYWGVVGGTQFRPNIIANGLKRSKHCLEYLHISQKGSLDQLSISSQNGEIPERVESLKAFETLRVLKVDASVLLGSEQNDLYNEGIGYAPAQLMAAVAGLPTTLEALHITKIRNSIFRFLEHLLPKDNPSPSPNLRSIHLLFEFKASLFVPPTSWELWVQRALEKDIALSRNVFPEPDQ